MMDELKMDGKIVTTLARWKGHKRVIPFLL